MLRSGQQSSLGELYRSFATRLARVNQRGNKTHPNIGNLLEESRIQLEAFADLIGYKHDVLERVETEDGQLAARVHNTFLLLHDAMNPVEVMLGLRDPPNDGTGIRLDALQHLRQLLQERLMPLATDFRRHDAYRGDLRLHSGSPKSRQSIRMEQHQPAAIYNHPVPFRSSTSPTTPFLEVSIKAEPLSPSNDDFASHSRPSTAGSLRRVSYESPKDPSSQSSLPSIHQLLSTTPPIQHATPSASSSESSPPTPFSPCTSHNQIAFASAPAPPPGPSTSRPDAGQHSNTHRRQHSIPVPDRWCVTLSPLQARGNFPSYRPNPMEPRMGSYSTQATGPPDRLKTSDWPVAAVRSTYVATSRSGDFF